MREACAGRKRIRALTLCRCKIGRGPWGQGDPARDRPEQREDLNTLETQRLSEAIAVSTTKHGAFASIAAEPEGVVKGATLTKSELQRSGVNRLLSHRANERAIILVSQRSHQTCWRPKCAKTG